MNERVKLTEREKSVMNEHMDADRIMLMSNSNDIETMIMKDKARKFNSDVEKFQENMEKRNAEHEAEKESIEYDINKAEIKPVYSRILVKPFSQNPFQKMEVSNGIIVDAGGYNPHTEINPATGKYEEQEQFIRTGVVVEVGPDCKYLAEGDVVYFSKNSILPIPFFKQRLVTLNENQVLVAVNEGLSKRWNCDGD